MHRFFNGTNDLLYLPIYVLSSETIRHHMIDGRLITVLFKDVVSSSDNTASNDSMTGE